MATNHTYIHALRFQWLNRLYDPVVRITTRETATKKTLVGFIPPAAQGKLLDVACGTGTLTRLIKTSAPGYRVCGIDGDSDMLARAKNKAGVAGIDIHYEHGLAQQLPYKSSAFDVVTSSLFFHHLTSADKRAAFGEIHRVLNTDGVLLLADWGRPQNSLMRVMFGLVQLLDGFETTGDNVRGALPGIIREAGFSGVECLRDMATPLGTVSILRASK